jgi:hypothetical protein
MMQKFAIFVKVRLAQKPKQRIIAICHSCESRNPCVFYGIWMPSLEKLKKQWILYAYPLLAPLGGIIGKT